MTTGSAVTDQEVLLHLFRTAGGESWRRRDGWAENDDFGSWFGVTTNDGGRVVKIDLPENNLRGIFPEEVGNLPMSEELTPQTDPLSGGIPEAFGSAGAMQSVLLWRDVLGKAPGDPTYLPALHELYRQTKTLYEEISTPFDILQAVKNLDFPGNQLTGEVPEELGSLPTLEELNLQHNRFTGSIPKALGKLRAVKKLHLSGNQLTGQIPEELGNLPMLETMYLFENKLSGKIPKELGNLQAAKIIDLSTNQLTGEIPEEFGNLPTLEELDLHSNQLSGTIPKELGNLQAVRILALSGNRLTGQIPAELGNLPMLEILFLPGNQLIGTIPKGFGNLQAATMLALSNNQLTGNIPTDLGNLQAAKILDLSTNQLTGQIPEELGNLPMLEIIYLHDNKLSGDIPTELGKLQAVKKLDFSSNQLTGEIPEELGNLPALEDLKLQTNQLRGEIPKEIGGLQAVKVILLSDNQLTGEIPEKLGNLPTLEALHLGSNQLSGSIPRELGNLQAVITLDISGNQLTGPIPEDLGNLPMLEMLNLHGNQLSGKIPTELGKLQVFKKLDLSDNQLTGGIPGDLGSLPTLEELNLQNNQLSGTIPVDLGNLHSVKVLMLSSNQLTGEIPKQLGNLQAVRRLGLASNQLTGEIPKELGDLQAVKEIDVSGNQLSEVPLGLFEALRARDGFADVLKMAENPISRPPQTVVEMGVEQAISWWIDIGRFGEGTSNKLKMMLVGLAEAGKTTVVRNITGKGRPLPKEFDRTVGIEITEGWQPDGGGPLEISVWDFAGQADYFASHQVFLTKGSLFLLVVDLRALFLEAASGVQNDGDPNGRVYRWLEMLHLRVPAAAVALVGTHTDAAEFQDPGNLEKAVSCLEQLIARYREDKAKEVASMEAVQGKRTPGVQEAYQGEMAPGLQEAYGAMLHGDAKHEENAPRPQGESAPGLKEGIGAMQHGEAKHEENAPGSQGESAPGLQEEGYGTMHHRDSKHEEIAPGQQDENGPKRRQGLVDRAVSSLRAPAPPIIHDKVFTTSLNDDSTTDLVEWVVKAATLLDCPAGFHFPAVCAKIPTAWIDANSAMDGLKAGGASGKRYVTWSEAVQTFGYFMETKGTPIPDPEEVLLRAMRHREAEGGVILSLKDDPARAGGKSGMLYLDPTWLIELIRRLTDHNLVDRANQDTLKDELERYGEEHCPRLDIGMLWRQHRSYRTSGTLDLAYLRFLWLYRLLDEDGMKLDLNLDEFNSMLATMETFLVLYRAPPTTEGSTRALYVVPARLPEYGDEQVLEKGNMGLGDFVVRTRCSFRRSYAPPSLIGRFLAFANAHIGEARECWQHGAHFIWTPGSHDVLVYEAHSVERRDSGSVAYPGLVLCVKGSTPAAREVLGSLTAELLRLFEDKVHGYPGLCSVVFEDTDVVRVSDLTSDLRKYLDNRFERLGAIMRKVAGVTSEVLQAFYLAAEDENQYPRLLILKPERARQPEAVEDRQSPAPAPSTAATVCETGHGEAVGPSAATWIQHETWKHWIDALKDRGEVRMVFICEHDMTEVECGPDGKGYLIKDLPNWVKGCLPLLQASLWAARVAVGMVSHVDLPLDDLLAAFVRSASTEVLGAMGTSITVSGLVGATPLLNNESTGGEDQQQRKRLQKEGYAALCQFMQVVESPSSTCCGSRYKCSSCGATRSNGCVCVSWRDEMVRVPNGKGGLVWVKNANKAAHAEKIAREAQRSGFSSPHA